MHRRYFLLGSAAAALRASSQRSPNDTVRIACVGVRGRGGDHIHGYTRLAGVEIAALCDVDESVLDKRQKQLESAGKKKPATYTDFRKLLEDKSIDAVSIATPNHWHALQTIWACQAGKDVYVEKPCAHDIFEARQMVAAARKYDRIVQHGTQSRAGVIREGVQKLHEGVIGDVYMARGLCYKWRDTIGRKPEEPAPQGVHYDLWLGPAPQRAFTRNRFHYNWHWFWDYGNGDIGNQGVHQLDVARWGLGVTYPTKVSAMGGHYMFDDDQETPNTMTALFEFDGMGKKKLLAFEVRHWVSNHEAGIGGSRPGNTVGNIFYGSKGYLVTLSEDEDGYYSYLGREQEPGAHRKGTGNHYANFLEVVRSRKREDLNAPIEEGAVSTELMHLANISYRVGRTLHFDPETMRCKGDDEANAMFTRPYRAPYVVPQKV